MANISERIIFYFQVIFHLKKLFRLFNILGTLVLSNFCFEIKNLLQSKFINSIF